MPGGAESDPRKADQWNNPIRTRAGGPYLVIPRIHDQDVDAGGHRASEVNKEEGA